MIAITGASGKLGRLVIESLLTKTDGENIVALVRDPSKVEDLKAKGIHIRQADYNQPETMASALAGIQKLLLISSSEVGSRAQQHQTVIDAAKNAGVGFLAYTSLLKADTSPMALAHEHKVTEAMIKKSEIPATILRNGWYSENYTESIEVALTHGAVAGAAENGQFNTATRKDYAEAAATVLTTDGHIGKVYELAGDNGFTLSNYADEVSRLSGKEIVYANMSGEDFAGMLVQVGLPEGFAQALADADIHAAKGWLSHDSQQLSQLIGRPTTPISESITAAL